MKILIVEDDETTASTIETYLTRDGFDVTIARSGPQGVEAARRELPHLVILDLMLPRLDGIEVCKALRAKYSLPIIMLTARTTEEDRLRGFGVGADDYVTKPFSPREVVARVKSVLRRSYDEAPRDAERFGNLLVDRTSRCAYVDGARLSLTPTEFKLLDVLSLTPGVPHSRSTLVERVFGHDYEGLERTLDVHIRNLRKKLSDASAGPAHIRTVFGVGYTFTKGGDA